jgi:hypothetical protein
MRNINAFANLVVIEAKINQAGQGAKVADFDIALHCRNLPVHRPQQTRRAQDGSPEVFPGLDDREAH